jgi:hypothetical protein
LTSGPEGTEQRIQRSEENKRELVVGAIVKPNRASSNQTGSIMPHSWPASLENRAGARTEQTQKVPSCSNSGVFRSFVPHRQVGTTLPIGPARARLGRDIEKGPSVPLVLASCSQRPIIQRRLKSFIAQPGSQRLLSWAFVSPSLSLGRRTTTPAHLFSSRKNLTIVLNIMRSVLLAPMLVIEANGKCSSRRQSIAISSHESALSRVTALRRC